MKPNYLFLVITLFLAVAADRAQAQVVTPNPTPTAITTVPYTITASGFYQLGANLTYTVNGSYPNAIITVNANNVTLDLGGHYISGPLNTPGIFLYGVFMTEHSNFTLQNGTIANCLVGVEIEGNGQSTSINYNHRLINLLVTYCYTTGINIGNASYVQVNDCRVSNIGGTTQSGSQGYAQGISFPGGAGIGCQVNGCTVSKVNGDTNKGTGIYALGAAVTGCTVDTVPGVGNTGIYDAILAVGNSVLNTRTGIYFDTAGKYKNNASFNCTTPFTGGTDGGGNN